MAEISEATELRAALHALADSLDDVALPSSGGEGPADDLLWTIRTYLLPRLEDLEAPLTVVLIGGTGAGKSTLVNSLAGAKVARPGVLRPMTRIPVVWCHERQRARYAEGLIGGSEAVPVEVVASDDPFLSNLTVIDSPDIDSVESSHREMAEALLAVADVCLFVTTPQRYADAVPWKFLQRAQERDVPLLYVMNRCRDGAISEIIQDFSDRMERGGLDLSFAEVIPISEQELLPHGGVSTESVEAIKSILEELAVEDDQLVIAQATAGSIASLRNGLAALTHGAELEERKIDQLRSTAESRYAEHQNSVGASLVSGTLLRSEITARWEEVLGTGQLMRSISEGVGKIRGWAERVFGGRGDRLEGEARSEITIAIERRTALAASETASAWELDELGRVLLEGNGTLWSASPETRQEIERQIEIWVDQVRALVEDQGSRRKTTARVASVGLNVVAVSLMLIVFSNTGGLTGAEVGIAAGAAAAQQTLLETVFGKAALRGLVSAAREGLMDAVGNVFTADKRRFMRLLEEASPRVPSELGTLMGAVDRAAEEFYAKPS